MFSGGGSGPQRVVWGCIGLLCECEQPGREGWAGTGWEWGLRQADRSWDPGGWSSPQWRWMIHLKWVPPQDLSDVWKRKKNWMKPPSGAPSSPRQRLPRGGDTELPPLPWRGEFGTQDHMEDSQGETNAQCTPLKIMVPSGLDQVRWLQVITSWPMPGPSGRHTCHVKYVSTQSRQSRHTGHKWRSVIRDQDSLFGTKSAQERETWAHAAIAWRVATQNREQGVQGAQKDQSDGMTQSTLGKTHAEWWRDRESKMAERKDKQKMSGEGTRHSHLWYPQTTNPNTHAIGLRVEGGNY